MGHRENFLKTEELFAAGAALVDRGELDAAVYRESVEMLCALADACDNGTGRELVEAAQRSVAFLERELLKFKGDE